MAAAQLRIDGASITQVRGLLAGAAIFTVFGALWVVMALIHWSARPGWCLPAVLMAAITLLGLCIARLSASRHIRRDDNPLAFAAGKRAGMLFGIIFGIEAGLIALCAIVLAHRGLELWIPIVAALIIGIHFLPLAKIFQVPLYYGTGVLMVLGVAGCLIIPDFALRLLCMGLMMTAVLWGSALVLLWQTRL